MNSAATLTQQVLADTRAAASLLNSKASPKDAQEYRDWTMAIAEKVANAATEGGFLGFGGERPSAPDKALPEQSRAAPGGPRRLVGYWPGGGRGVTTRPAPLMKAELLSGCLGSPLVEPLGLLSGHGHRCVLLLHLAAEGGGGRASFARTHGKG